MDNNLGSIVNILLKLYNKNMSVIKIIIVVIILAGNSMQSFGQNFSSKELIGKMHKSIKTYRDFRFKLYRSERVNGKQVLGCFDGKLTMDPFMIYIKNIVPNEGSELMYKEGENNNKAWVNPDIFPYITMSFYPESSLLKAGGHHTLKDAGFDLLDEIFKFYEMEFKDKLYQHLENRGVVDWKGLNCYKLILNHPDYKIINYSATKNETLAKIANNKLLNSYKLKELNPSIRETKNLNEGQIIKVPNAYAKKVVIYLATDSFLPVYQEIYDEIGLYEKYVYKDLTFGTKIPLEEFSIDNEDYGF